MGKTGRVDLARSPDGGLTWSDPVTVFDLPDRDDSMNLLVQLANGTLVAGIVSYTWDDGQGHGLGWEADIYVIRSRDQGRTWSDPRRIDVVPLDWIYPFGRPVELEDGTLLLSGYGGYLHRNESKKSKSKWGHTCFVVRSHDQGQTWGEYTVVAKHFNEICMARLPSGKLAAVLRSDKGSTYLSFSSDEGRSWSQPRQVTGTNEHPADLLVLADVRLLMSHGVRHQPFGVQAMLSRDEGASWETKQKVLLA